MSTLFSLPPALGPNFSMLSGGDHPDVSSQQGFDQIPDDSVLRELYESPAVRRFLGRILGIEVLHPYADELSSINVHFHRDGEELGWHFDNSSFAVTLLIQAPEAGGRFQYVPDLRDADG